MNKKIALLTVSCFVISIGVVILLFAMSGVLKDKHNSFLRQFPPHPVMEGDTLNIRYSNYYIAGTTRHTIYLGNYTVPLHLLVLSMTLADTQHITLNVKGIYDQKFWSAKVQVDSPFYYLTDGAVPILFKGNVYDWRAERFMSDSVYFRDIVPITSGSFAVKSLSGSKAENILGRITSWPPHEWFTDRILQRQQDGVFCTDGMMTCDKEINQLIYLYYYRNEFMVMDTSLNLRYRGHTIDTISVAKIKTATYSSSKENTHTLSSPPYIVNKRSCIDGNRLFVNSNLLAKNEHEKAFAQGEVIDVYDLTTGKYVFSFYIYHYWGTKKMIEFKVIGDKMVVLYDKLIRVFHLVPSYFPADRMKLVSIN